MANTTFKNAAGATEYNKSTGAGTDVDPKIMEVSAAALTTLAGALDTGAETPAVAVEGATPRTVTSLLKGIKNTLYNAGVGLLSADGGWGGPAVVWGVSGVPKTSADLSGAGAAAVTDVPTSGQKLVLLECHITSAVDVVLTFTCQTSGAVLFYVRCPAKCTTSKIWRGKKKLATADKYVIATADVAGAVTVDMGYYSEV
jgi:hypothetical protein